MGAEYIDYLLADQILIPKNKQKYYTSFINIQQSSFMSLVYLFYFPTITAAWFAFVSFALTHDSLGDIFNKHTDNIQFASSAFIAGLGLLILLQAMYGLR